MKEIKADKNLVSCCWLYCGACKKYLNNKCPGCKELTKTPVWCSIRDCCMEKAYENCAQCKEYPDVKECKKYNGFVMKTLSYFCGSDRFSATNMIKENGIESFAELMAKNKCQRINRKKTLY